MPLTSTSDRYGAVARLLHWALALLIILLLASGELAGEVLPKATVIPVHKALGILALVLGVARLAWWAADRIRPVNTGGGIKDTVATVVKIGLALLGLAVPLSGWLLSSAAGKPIVMFGLATVPALLAPDKALAGLFKEMHELGANLLLAALALHIAGALYHHFVLKDDVMLRMAPHAKKAAAGADA